MYEGRSRQSTSDVQRCTAEERVTFQQRVVPAQSPLTVRGGYRWAWMVMAAQPSQHRQCLFLLLSLSPFPRGTIRLPMCLLKSVCGHVSNTVCMVIGRLQDSSAKPLLASPCPSPQSRVCGLRAGGARRLMAARARHLEARPSMACCMAAFNPRSKLERVRTTFLARGRKNEGPPRRGSHSGDKYADLQRDGASQYTPSPPTLAA